jgi:hypothetical protein
MAVMSSLLLWALVPGAVAAPPGSAELGEAPPAHARFATARWARMGFPADGSVLKGDHVAVEVGARVGEALEAGLLLAAGTHDGLHYEIQAGDPAASDPLGDLQLWRAGAMARLRAPVGPLLLGGRGELAFASWHTPFDEVAYNESVIPAVGRARASGGMGAWLGGAFEAGLPLAEGGPVATLSVDVGYLAAQGFSGLASGFGLGVGAGF